jgi:hypothetical protein
MNGYITTFQLASECLEAIEDKIGMIIKKHNDEDIVFYQSFVDLDNYPVSLHDMDINDIRSIVVIPAIDKLIKQINANKTKKCIVFKDLKPPNIDCCSLKSEESGISLRVIRQYHAELDSYFTRLDVLYGFVD